MWRKGSMFFNASFGRQLKISRLNTPITLSHQGQVGRIHRALNLNSSSYCCYYYSVVSPRHEWEPGWFMRNIQRRFMWNDTSEKKHIEAAVDALKLSGRCFEDIIVGSSEEYRKTLLSRDYFAETIGNPPQDISGEVIDLYVMWAIGRDDFKIDHDLLRQMIYVYTKPNMLCRDNWEKVMYSIWDMMLTRSAAFKEEGVVSFQLLTILLSNFPNSGLLPRQQINMLQVFGCVPTLHCYSGNAANTCVNLSHADDPCFARVRQNILDIVGSRPTFCLGHVGSSLMFFCDQDLLELAHHVYVAAKDKLIPPLPLPGEVFHLVRLLSYKDDEASLRLAVDILADDAARTSKRSGAAFTSVVAGLCRVNDLRGAQKLIHDMILNGPPPGIRAFSALIKSLCLSGDLEGAFHMLQLAESRRLEAYLGLYRLLIKGYKKRGMLDQASKLLSMAARKHPDSTLKVV